MLALYQLLPLLFFSSAVVSKLTFVGDSVDIKTPEGKKIFDRIASPKNPKFPRPLTPKVAEIYRHIVAVSLKYPEQAPIPAENIAGSARYVDDVVDYGDTDTHCPQLIEPLILRAKEEVLLATFLFDWRTECARRVIRAIKKLDKKLEGTGDKVRFLVAIDTVSMLDYGRHSWQTRWRLKNVWSEKRIIDPRAFTFPNPNTLKNIKLVVKTTHQFILGALHSKLLVVDGRWVVTGSKNIDVEDAHEYAFTLEGSAALSARADFEDIWGTGPLPPLKRAITKPRTGEVPTLYVGRRENPEFFNKMENNPQDQAWIGAFRLATRNIYVESPNFISFTVVNEAIRAARRGVKVNIVTSYYMADEAQIVYMHSYKTAPLMAKHVYEVLAGEPEAMKNIKICWFIGKRVQPAKVTVEEWTHVKAMTVDDEFAYIGTGNQDPQTWYHSREDNYIIDDPAITKHVKAILLEDQQSLRKCFHNA